jgi:sigma-B regulation protein RsbU (phosphoserine phosphatase)
MVPEMPYDTRTLTLPPDARLLVYSDGAYEIEKPDGKMWEFHEFAAHITPEFAAGGNLLDRHLAFIRGLGGGATLGDDCSLMEVRFPPAPPPPEPRRKRKPAEPDQPG